MSYIDSKFPLFSDVLAWLALQWLDLLCARTGCYVFFEASILSLHRILDLYVAKQQMILKSKSNQTWEFEEEIQYNAFICFGHFVL